MGKNSVAVVTGGSRGIGRAICVALAKEGCHVVINYSGNEGAALETLQLCNEVSPLEETAPHLVVQADVSTQEGAKKLIDAADAAFGQVDILVNNAGRTKDGLMMRMKAEDFTSVLNLNLQGTFLCCQAVLKQMLRRRHGRIINLSSVVGLHGNAGQVNYSASKAGVIGLTKSMAKEVASRGITVNAVAPGYIDTDMTAILPETVKEHMLTQVPVGRIGLPEDIAKAVRFLASDEASYITGQVLSVDGGMSM